MKRLCLIPVHFQDPAERLAQSRCLIISISKDKWKQWQWVGRWVLWNEADFQWWSVLLVSCGCYKSYYKLSGWKTTQICYHRVLTWLRSLTWLSPGYVCQQGCQQGVSKAVCPAGGWRGESISLPFPASRVSRVSPFSIFKASNSKLSPSHIASFWFLTSASLFDVKGPWDWAHQDNLSILRSVEWQPQFHLQP